MRHHKDIIPVGIYIGFALDYQRDVIIYIAVTKKLQLIFRQGNVAVDINKHITRIVPGLHFVDDVVILVPLDKMHVAPVNRKGIAVHRTCGDHSEIGNIRDHLRRRFAYIVDHVVFKITKPLDMLSNFLRLSVRFVLGGKLLYCKRQHQDHADS